MERQTREFYIAAAKAPGAGFHALIRDDWKDVFALIQLDAEDLAMLDSYGLWSDINTQCAVFIDIFEEAEVAPDKLGALIGCLERSRTRALEAADGGAAMCDRLLEFVVQAQARAVPVWLLF